MRSHLRPSAVRLGGSLQCAPPDINEGRGFLDYKPLASAEEALEPPEAGPTERRVAALPTGRYNASDETQSLAIAPELREEHDV